MTRPDSNHTFVHHVAFWIIVGFFWMVQQLSFFNKLSESFINTLLDSWNMSWTRFLQHFELLHISKTYTYWTCLLEVLLECFFHTVVANVSWTRLSNICLKDFLWTGHFVNIFHTLLMFLNTLQTGVDSHGHAESFMWCACRKSRTVSRLCFAQTLCERPEVWLPRHMRRRGPFDPY